jgi:hypothetical protein
MAADIVLRWLVEVLTVTGVAVTIWRWVRAHVLEPLEAFEDAQAARQDRLLSSDLDESSVLDPHRQVGGKASRRPAAVANPAPLPLRRATPNAVLDAVGEGVFQTGHLDRAHHTNLPCDLHPHPVARKESLGREFPTHSFTHP